MSARSSLYGFLLALVLVISACSKDEVAIKTMDELTTLTDDLVKTVNDAADKKAGVADAQKQLDAAKGELGAKMKDVMDLRGFQVSEETQTKLAGSLIDNTFKMSRLEIDLMMETMSDAELKAALDKLLEDHQALVSGK
jgi:restriction endonuclease